MKYRVVGKNKETGRKRTRTYTARSSEDARVQAEEDGVLVESVIELPPTPPTQAQVEYATRLGIAIPADVTVEEISDLISLNQQRDKPAPPDLRELAEGYGLYFTKYVGKKNLFQQIFYALQQAGREKELVAWFTYRVYRELMKGSSTAEIKTPHDKNIQRIASELIELPGVVDSIRRYNGEDLVWFGQWTTASGIVLNGGSNRTKAYKEAAQRLRRIVSTESSETAGQELRVYEAKFDSHPPQHTNSSPKSSSLGCLPVIAGVFMLAGFYIFS